LAALSTALRGKLRKFFFARPKRSRGIRNAWVHVRERVRPEDRCQQVLHFLEILGRIWILQHLDLHRFDPQIVGQRHGGLAFHNAIRASLGDGLRELFVTGSIAGNKLKAEWTASC
jgi:hypothetical protein